MGRLNASLIALLLLAGASLGLAACGSGGGAELLPGETASEIKSNIDQVEQLVAAGDCIGAEDASAAVSGQVASRRGVDSKLKRALAEGAERLDEVVAECQEEAPEEEVEAFEEPEEAEDEEREREKQEKPSKERSKEQQAEEEPEKEAEGPTLPPQANGKGEEKGNGSGQPEAEPPSGGISPGVEAGEG